MKTIVLLTISNIFMTFAWYGHLKFKDAPLPRVILISWCIALFEYCFQVPANRIGHGEFSAAELKTMQEVITLIVFRVFSMFYLGEPLKWNYLVGFLCIVAAVFFVFHNGRRPARHHHMPSGGQCFDSSKRAFTIIAILIQWPHPLRDVGSAELKLSQ